MSGLTRGGLGLAAALGVLALAPCPATASPNTLCTLRPGTSALPPGARHGLAHHLRQYPDLGLATPAQVHAARQLLVRIRRATRAYASAEVAAAHGFDTDLARRAPGDLAVGYLHAEHRLNSADRHVLDPARPESLIYATEPGRRPRLIGAMFSVARGVLGPTPAGPIARWHAHLVCRRGDKRGLAPPVVRDVPWWVGTASREARCCTSGSRPTSEARSPSTHQCPSSVVTGFSLQRPVLRGRRVARCDEVSRPARCLCSDDVRRAERSVQAACDPDRDRRRPRRGGSARGPVGNPFGDHLGADRGLSRDGAQSGCRVPRSAREPSWGCGRLRVRRRNPRDRRDRRDIRADPRE